MSQKIFQITEQGEKMITDAFYETVEHGYPPPSHPAGEEEESLRVLCASIVLTNGVSGDDLSRLIKDSGLSDHERNDLILTFAAVTLAFQLRDTPLMEAVVRHLADTGLADRIGPHLNMIGIDVPVVARQIQEDMAKLEPKPMLEITLECCDDQPESDTMCCTDEEVTRTDNDA